MLFLVAKSSPQPPKELRYRGHVYALLSGLPPIPKPKEMDADEAIRHGVLPLTALTRTKWKSRSTHKDIEENGVIVKRQGLTELKGTLFWKGKFVQPEITLEFTWEYTLDPSTGKYLLSHAALEDGSSHELVDENGEPTPFEAALFTIRHALGKNPTTPPEPLSQPTPQSVPQRYARVIRYDGYLYHLAELAA